jgi:hypothetical protein
LAKYVYKWTYVGWMAVHTALLRDERFMVAENEGLIGRWSRFCGDHLTGGLRKAYVFFPRKA